MQRAPLPVPQDPAVPLPTAVFDRLVQDLGQDGPLRLPTLAQVPPEVLVRFVWRRWAAWSGVETTLWQVGGASDPGVQPGDWLQAPTGVGRGERWVWVDPAEEIAVGWSCAQRLRALDTVHATATDATLREARAALQRAADLGQEVSLGGDLDTAKALVVAVHALAGTRAPLLFTRVQRPVHVWLLLDPGLSAPDRAPRPEVPPVYPEGLTRPPDRAFADILGDSPALAAVLLEVKRLAPSRVPVLITGETGSGKEGIADALHAASGRREKLVKVNVASIAPGLAESELFGHRRGSFSGATGDHDGLFVKAEGGTLFLDEIGELPLGLQAKLLRALDPGEVTPIGGTAIRVNVRCVAATNRDLWEAVRDGTFREDLYYRLAAHRAVRLPPLRHRREDILPLWAHYFKTVAKRAPRLDPEAEQALLDWAWPGNVRELKDLAESVALDAARSPRVTVEHLGEVGARRGPRFRLTHEVHDADIALPPMWARPGAVAHHLRVATAGFDLEPLARAYLEGLAWTAAPQLQEALRLVRGPRWSLAGVRSWERRFPPPVAPSALTPPSAPEPAAPGRPIRPDTPPPPADDLAWLSAFVADFSGGDLQSFLARIPSRPQAPARWKRRFEGAHLPRELESVLRSPEGDALVALLQSRVGAAAWEDYRRQFPPAARALLKPRPARAAGSPGSA